MRNLIIFSSLLIAIDGNSIALASGNEAVVNAVQKFGISFSKGLIELNNSDTKRAKIDNKKAAKAVDAILKNYNKRKAVLSGGVAMGRAASDLTIDGLTILGTATGIGAVPAAVFKGAAQLGSDLYFEGLEKKIDQDLKGYLGKHKKEIIEAVGGDYKNIKQLEPQELRQRLFTNNKIFENLKDQFKGDENVENMFQDIVVETLRTTQLKTLDEVAKNAGSINKLEKELGKAVTSIETLKTNTLKTFEEHEKAINSLGKAVGELKTSVSDINKRLGTIGKNQGFIADFVLNNLPPKTKAEYLKAGFLSERFECASGETKCNAADLKKDLIKRFEAEAELQDAIVTVQKTAGKLANVASIANNLGFKIKGLDEAANIAQVGAAAFAQFATGNYLGAVSSVTGLFAKKKDPDQERFKIMMAYLKKEFKKINLKLDAILENQNKLFEQLVSISEQMQKFYISQDERFEDIDFKLTMALDLLRINHWKEWKNCETAVFDIKNHFPNILKNSDFVSIDAVFQGVNASGPHTRECFLKAKNDLVSLSNIQRYGNFLNVEFALNYFPPEEQLTDLQKRKFKSKSELSAFLKDFFKPISELVISEMHKKEIGSERLLQLLSQPQMFTSELSKDINQQTKFNSCQEEKNLFSPSIKRLICNTSNSTEAANFLLKRAMQVDGALEIGQHLMVIARMVDLLDQSGNNFMSKKVLKEHIRNGSPGIARGKSVLQGVVSMLDATIATYHLRHGAISAKVLGNVLLTPLPKEKAAKEQLIKKQELAGELLKANHYLQKNVALYALQKEYGIRDATGQVSNSQINKHTYQNALEFASSMQVKPNVWLENIFGKKFAFTRDKGKVFVQLASNGVKAEMPSPDEFYSGRFSYPQRMRALLSLRKKVIERILDYGALDGIDKDAAFAFAQRLN